MRLSHLHLHVADVSRSRVFYEQWFGLVEDVWHGDILFLRDDDGFQLALAPRPVEPMPPWWHFGFRLGSKADVRALHDAMTRNGEPVAESDFADEDFAYFRVLDPDRYLIEVYWE